jgi:hypothetical protein
LQTQSQPTPRKNPLRPRLQHSPAMSGAGSRPRRASRCALVFANRNGTRPRTQGRPRSAQAGWLERSRSVRRRRSSTWALCGSRPASCRASPGRAGRRHRGRDPPDDATSALGAPHRGLTAPKRSSAS